MIPWVWLSLVKRAAPDLILIDIRMNGMVGYEVCRQIKSDLATRKLPINFVTAMGEEEDES